MDLYPWVVFLHVVAVIVSGGAHGVSAFAMFRVKSEKDRVRIGAYLDESERSLIWAGIGLLIAIVLGITAAVMGNHFSRLWPWAAIVVLVVIIGIMTPFAANPMSGVRQALGLPSRMDKKGAGPPPPADDATLADAQAKLQPALVALLGVIAVAILVYLMEFKPF
jgi:hypothetical protein